MKREEANKVYLKNMSLNGWGPKVRKKNEKRREEEGKGTKLLQAAAAGVVAQIIVNGITRRRDVGASIKNELLNFYGSMSFTTTYSL